LQEHRVVLAVQGVLAVMVATVLVTISPHLLALLVLLVHLEILVVTEGV
jgi:hypothetical protein